MKVLIIDDIPDSVKRISDFCDEKGWTKQIVGFEIACKTFFEYNPDVLILDWFDDGELADNENETSGGSLFSIIWKNSYRPIVVFSANASLINLDDKLKQSQMLKLIPKGDEQPVCDYLEKLEKVSSALTSFRSDMGEALIESLNTIDLLTETVGITNDAVEYVLAKRTEAFFDGKYISALSPSWVQYLCPPVGNSLMVCDILFKKTENEEDRCNPENFLLVLTPSCDLSCDNGQMPKVSDVLCARCCGKETFHKYGLLDVLDATKSVLKKIDDVKKKLNLGYNGSCVPLPKFSDVIPYMTVDLKRLVLLPLEKIATIKSNINETTEYIRVASICSPFREQIVWAHLQNSCRPGVPERNTEFWAKEILVK